MKKSLSILISLATGIIYAQSDVSFNKHWNLFNSIDYGLNIGLDSDRVDYYNGNTGRTESFRKKFFNGLQANYGYGVAYNEWLRLSVNTGIHWMLEEKVVSLPAFSSIAFAPRISDELRIIAEYSIGYSTALGRGNLNGVFQRGRLGLEINDGITLYFNITDHGYRIKNQPVSEFGIGFGATFF